MSSKIRKGQLVTTFGVGAMHVDSNGTSVMTCGLDHWFEDEGGNPIENIDLYRVEDKRLSGRLGVNHFRTPPDEKTPPINHDGNSRTLIKSPLSAVRFPQWHVCSNPTCQLMHRTGNAVRSKPRCVECNSIMYQSRFVVVCDNGHIDDFPWLEWVHRSPTPNCNGAGLKLIGGGGSLSSMVVHCSDCDKKRTLGRITIMDENGSHITSKLSETEIFNCRGKMPWLGNYTEECDRPIVGILRQATNVYFSNLISSIHLPIETIPELSDIVDMLESDEGLVSDIIAARGTSVEFQIRHVKAHEKSPLMVKEFSDQDILNAIEVIAGERERTGSAEDVDETVYRRQERVLLLRNTDRGTLKCSPLDLKNYEKWVGDVFSNITLVERLTETRAMVGFDRLSVTNSNDIEYHKAQLRRIAPAEDMNWLPALRVYGEGIYIEFRHDKLVSWAGADNVKARAEIIVNNLANNDFVRRETVSPVFLLLHTFAHLLMNRLVFDCGYSSAALRERIYESTDPDSPMAGLLIYTASGDSEGSLGGLVSKGRPGEIEPIISSALAEAGWCSSDPVCTEAGVCGQGPGSLNLAACHSCALIPETSCEEMNMFLDRQCVISHENDGRGYFDKMGI